MENYRGVAIVSFIIVLVIAMGVGFADTQMLGEYSYLCCTLPIVLLFSIYLSSWYVKERDKERLISSQERMAKQQEKIAEEEERILNKTEEPGAIKVRCRWCKSLNEEDAEYCKKCGKKL